MALFSNKDEARKGKHRRKPPITVQTSDGGPSGTGPNRKSAWRDLVRKRRAARREEGDKPKPEGRRRKPAHGRGDKSEGGTRVGPKLQRDARRAFRSKNNRTGGPLNPEKDTKRKETKRGKHAERKAKFEALNEKWAARKDARKAKRRTRIGNKRSS